MPNEGNPIYFEAEPGEHFISITELFADTDMLPKPVSEFLDQLQVNQVLLDQALVALGLRGFFTSRVSFRNTTDPRYVARHVPQIEDSLDVSHPNYLVEIDVAAFVNLGVAQAQASSAPEMTLTFVTDALDSAIKSQLTKIAWEEFQHDIPQELLKDIVTFLSILTVVVIFFSLTQSALAGTEPRLAMSVEAVAVLALYFGLCITVQKATQAWNWDDTSLVPLVPPSTHPVRFFPILQLLEQKLLPILKVIVAKNHSLIVPKNE